MALLKMSEEEFKLLSDLIYNYCGLTFTGSQKILFQKRVKSRVEKLRLSSFKEYYQFLKYDPKREEELKVLVDLLTVNETYFFREPAQFDALINFVLPEISKNTPTKHIKIWSAACSTGAEPYTIAILLKEKKPLDESWRVEIIGTDISISALEEARKGIYTEAAFRTTPPEYKKKYFTKTPEGYYKISDEIKRMVSFRYLNLLNKTQMSLMKNIHVIFCRNVLIYFDLEAKKKVVESFYQSLVKGGYLFIGQSESLFKVTNLYKLVPTSKVLLYKKE